MALCSTCRQPKMNFEVDAVPGASQDTFESTPDTFALATRAENACAGSMQNIIKVDTSASEDGINETSQGQFVHPAITDQDLPEVFNNESEDVPTTGINDPCTPVRLLFAACDFPSIENCTVQGNGYVFNENGKPVGKIIDGLPWHLEGCVVNSRGEIWNDCLMGHAVPIPSHRNTQVREDNNVVDEHGRIIGRLWKGNVPPATQGLHIDSEHRVRDEKGVQFGWVEIPLLRSLTSQELDLVQLLEGLTVSEDSFVYDRRGNAVGRMLYGSIETARGNLIVSNGQFDLDESIDPDFVLPQVVPLQAAEYAWKFEAIREMAIHIDGRVRNWNDKIVARIVQGELLHSVSYEIVRRGEIVERVSQSFIGLVDLVDRMSLHSPGPNCPPDCFDCTSKAFNETIPHDEQVELLAKCMRHDLRPWPLEHVKPRIVLHTDDKLTGKAQILDISTSRSVDQMCEVLLDHLEPERQGEFWSKNVCIIENANRYLVRKLGYRGVDIDFFYEHFRVPGSTAQDPFESQSYSRTRGTIQGYFVYSDQKLHRQLSGGRVTAPSLSARLSYNWLRWHWLLILVDSLQDEHQDSIAKAAWGEWHFSNERFGRDVIPIPMRYGNAKSELFDVLKQDLLLGGRLSALPTVFDRKCQCLYPDLVFATSFSVLANNVLQLEDDIKRVSFSEIQSPDRSTNEALHALREELHYIKTTIYRLTRLIPFYSELVGHVGYTQVADIHEPHLKNALDHVTRTELLLTESFQLLLSSLSADDNYRGFQQATKANRITVLAFIYVPLSFVTGIFGMNLNSVNGSPLPYWACLIASAAVVVITGGFWLIHYYVSQQKKKRQEQRKKAEKMA